MDSKEAMETVIPEDTMNCPICFEIPKNEIFQCVNGHIVCSDCSKNISRCPQCSVPYGPTKIRNRTLESILDVVLMTCTYKTKGCKVRVTRREFLDHTENCSFGEVKLCEHLGFTCGFTMNINQMQEGAVHLREIHESDLVAHSSMMLRIRLIETNATEGLSKYAWPPTIVNANGTIFLIALVQNIKEGFVSINFIGASGSGCKSYLGEFRIKSLNPEKFPDLVWIATPTSMKHALVTIDNPIFQFPQQLWNKYTNSNDGKVLINFKISRTG